MENNNSILKDLMVKSSSYIDLDEYKKAIECNDCAIKIDPKFKQAYFNKGFAYYQLNEFTKAI